MDKFYTYSFDDFLNDVTFISFVKGTNPEDEALWLNWLATHPANLDAYNTARGALLTLHSVKPITDTEANQRHVWENIEEGIARHNKAKTRTISLRIWSSAAAAVLLLFAGLAWYYNSRINITTAYGEQRMVQLPDGSRVHLNANSTLSYWRAWQWHRSRETWLKGEALFDVVHLNHNAAKVEARERFSVHAGPVDINVLGTVFNVKQRRNKLLIALIKGRVQVADRSHPQNNLILTPGNAAHYQQQHFERQAVTKLENKPLAWTNKAMETRGITVADIVADFEDTYGGNIVVDRPELLQKRIDGFISLESRESTLYMLANLLNATIEHREGTYYLRSK